MIWKLFDKKGLVNNYYSLDDAKGAAEEMANIQIEWRKANNVWIDMNSEFKFMIQAIN